MGAVHNFQLDMSWPKKKVKRQKLSDEPTTKVAKNGDENDSATTKYYLLTVLDSTMMMLFDECIGVIVAAANNEPHPCLFLKLFGECTPRWWYFGSISLSPIHEVTVIDNELLLSIQM